MRPITTQTDCQAKFHPGLGTWIVNQRILDWSKTVKL